MQRKNAFFTYTLILLLSCVGTSVKFIEPVRVATTWTVDDYGPADFRTIQEAINLAERGDIVYVKAGTYLENVIVNKTVSLIGEGQEITIIDGGGVNNVIKIEANNIVIEGFHIRNDGGSGIDITGYDYTTIRNNSIIGNQIQFTEGIHISNSFHNNISKNTVANWGYSICVDYYSSNNSVCSNNVWNSTFGIDIEGGGNNFHGNDIRNNFYGISIGACWISLRCIDINNNNLGSPIYPNPCSNAAFRHALWHTVDRPYIINNIWKESYHPMYTPMSPAMSQYAHPEIAPGRSLENLTHPYNLTEAARILDNAGFIDTDGDGWRNFPVAVGGDGKNIMLKYFVRSDSSPRMEMGLWHVAQIEAIGIIVNETMVPRMVEEVYIEKDFHLYTGGWGLLAWDVRCLSLYHSNYCRGPGMPWVNYDCVNSTEYDYWVGELLGARAVDDAVYASMKAQEVFNNPDCVGAIPLLQWYYEGLIEVVGNTVSGNNLANNLYGIILGSSSQNLVYHNNFIDNSRQLYSNASTNVWDDGYPSGGNFWSDHNPPDMDGDMIGDSPYFIDENNTDSYPLIYPYGFVHKPDLNGDGIVNILDLTTVALAFGAKPGDSNWNETADMDKNGEVNIIDLSTVAIDFGKTV